MIGKKSSEKTAESVSKSKSSFSIAEAKFFPALNQEERSEALFLASQLDTRYETILRFGEEVQKSLKDFTHQLLVQVQRNDTSPIREILSNLVEQLDSINLEGITDQRKGFFRKLFKPKASIQQIISQYNRLSKQIDRLTIHLKRAQENLLKDNALLNQLYERNEDYFHRINLYIAALEMKKMDLLKELKILEHQLDDRDNPMFEQKLSDLQNAIEWLDRRMYDLQLSREIAIQTAPQIRMIQSTNEMLIEKIQSSILSTIPLWQSQISMLVNLNRQHRANETGKSLGSASEMITRKNSEMMSLSVEKKFGPEELTHLKETQEQLMESIAETLRIHDDRSEKQQTFKKTMQDIGTI
ncbi:toxic anion resistance protein [Ureibacillus terrenus]|uniref:toxic anion resistance protein n=1 Tax=Ureibacillus terrenus TaxID=118246 RepID=UPI002E1C605E|nr:toxic anion resistance protein [Ureibacillus terrenus]